MNPDQRLKIQIFTVELLLLDENKNSVIAVSKEYTYIKYTSRLYVQKSRIPSFSSSALQEN